MYYYYWQCLHTQTIWCVLLSCNLPILTLLTAGTVYTILPSPEYMLPVEPILSHFEQIKMGKSVPNVKVHKKTTRNIRKRKKRKWKKKTRSLNRKLLKNPHQEVHQRNSPGTPSQKITGKLIKGALQEAHQRNPPGTPSQELTGKLIKGTLQEAHQRNSPGTLSQEPTGKLSKGTNQEALKKKTH